MDAWEQDYLDHREFSNSPVRQAEYDLNRQMAAEEQMAQEEAAQSGEDDGVLGRMMGLPGEVGKGVVEGVSQLGQDVVDLTQFLSGPLRAKNPQDPGDIVKAPKPGFAEPKGIPESLARGFGQFAPMFFPAARALGVGKAVTRAGRVARGATAGAAADFAGDPEGGNLFGILDDVTKSLAPEMRLEVFEALKTSPDDTQLKKRLKNALAGAPLGVGLDTAVESISYLWKRGNLRRFAGDLEKAFKAAEPKEAEVKAELVSPKDISGSSRERELAEGVESYAKSERGQEVFARLDTKLEIEQAFKEGRITAAQRTELRKGVRGASAAKLETAKTRLAEFERRVMEEKDFAARYGVSADQHGVDVLRFWAETEGERRGISTDAMMGVAATLSKPKYRKLLEPK